MMSKFRITKRASWLWPVLLVALVAGALALAACGGEDPTATPEPTATPVPTAAPVPTPTPEPTATPVPEPDSSMMSITDIDENATVGDLIGALSEEETACINMAFGEAILESLKDQPLSTVADSFSLFPLQCLSQENAISAVVTMISIEAGGLSAQSRDCISSIYREDPTLLTSQEMSAFEFFACLTPEEAEALTPPDEGPAPDPAAIACLMEELSGTPSGEKIIAVLSGQDPSGQGLTMEESAMLGQAVEACGIETEFGFPEP